jgi:serine/threonine protein kinase
MNDGPAPNPPSDVETEAGSAASGITRHHRRLFMAAPPDPAAMAAAQAAAAAAAGAPAAAPVMIGKYQLLAEIGKGTSGTVKKVVDTTNGAVMALKVLTSCRKSYV